MSRKVAAIYCRISLDTEGQELGVQRQEADCRALADRLGLDVQDVYVDNDLGASTRSRAKTRPQYQAMLERARSGAYAYLLAYSNSRLTRRPLELEDLIRLHEQTGVRIATVASGEDDLSTADGRMVARIKASVDAGEAERTSERVARKHLESARAGLPVGGTRPFGWEDDKVTVREAEAALIRKAASDVLAGTPIREVCRRWNDAGVLTSTGREWAPATLRQMLKSPRLAGWRVHRGQIATGVDGEPVRGRWAAILDAGEHARLGAYLSRPDGRARVPRRDARHYLLTGSLRCGICNRPMYGNARDYKGRRVHYYSCTGFGHALSLSSAADDAVSALVLARLAHEDEIAEPETTWSDAERLEDVEGQIAELMAAFRARRLSGAVVFGSVEELERERDDLRAERRRWEASTAGPRIVAMDAEAWGALDVSRRRAIIERLMTAVIVAPPTKRSNRFDPDRLAVVWRED